VGSQSNSLEKSRIEIVYSKRLSKAGLYKWSSPSYQYFDSQKKRLLYLSILYAFGDKIDNLRVLDVGCGNGTFLRTLVEWGAAPDHLMGTEFLEDRIDDAKDKSPQGIAYHLGDLAELQNASFSLVSSHLVFSSILDNRERKILAKKMWNLLDKDGWILIFDFRYNNPSNPDVKKVTKKDLDFWFPSGKRKYFVGILAPPLARRVIRTNYFVAELLTKLFPFLRSHFIYMVKKSN